jgi:hypothetical protein
MQCNAEAETCKFRTEFQHWCSRGYDLSYLFVPDAYSRGHHWFCLISQKRLLWRFMEACSRNEIELGGKVMHTGPFATNTGPYSYRLWSWPKLGVKVFVRVIAIDIKMQ